MKWNTVKVLAGDEFRRLTGVKKATFDTLGYGSLVLPPDRDQLEDNLNLSP